LNSAHKIQISEMR